jgi:ureidoacrylate peracid hydrolase
MKSASLFALVTVASFFLTACRTVPRQSGPSRVVVVPAAPRPVEIDLRKTAVIVVDMQNDFGSKGGMLDRAGIDVSGVQQAVAPTARALAAARKAGVPIVYLKMGYHADLSDLGTEGSPNRTGHQHLHVGESVPAPNGEQSRILVRDTWNTQIVDGLKPQPGDVAIYKTRFSGFYNTDLDAILKRRGVTKLIMTGCNTTICLESTIRDAMFRDYSTVLLSDCTAEAILPRSNYDASLLVVQTILGSVSTSDDFIRAVGGVK